MPSACTPFAESAERHTIAVRNAFASIAIHIPKSLIGGKRQHG
jgi:hypothetical protein